MSERFCDRVSQMPFIIEDEQHDWLHVAIDRFTGRVLYKQIEVVNEWLTPNLLLPTMFANLARCYAIIG